ncbi:MAG: sigma-70 family RNA polymerase sigma factor [Oscillospiraceae bacterium]
MIVNPSSLSDNELIAAIHRDSGRQGKDSKDAVSIIISRYMKLVLKRAHTYSDNCSDLEDLTQEGLLALCNAIESFSCENGAKFSSFADTCVTNRIRTAAAAIAKHKENDISVIADENDIADADSSPENICLEKENDSSIRRKVESVLAPMEVKVFELYFDGRSYREIADILGISEKSVDNAVFRIRKKLKMLLGGK